MLKRLLSPLTLVNQLALIVLLLALLGVAGMSLSGWLAKGMQGNAHAINKSGSMRMQSYRLLAALPLSEKDYPLLDEMEKIIDSQDLQLAAEQDGQQASLGALQQYWHEQLAPALRRAGTIAEVKPLVVDFVARIDRLVTLFDTTTEMRLQRIVQLQLGMAALMGLLIIFTVIWLRSHLLRPWKKLLAMARAVGQRDFTRRVTIRGRNEMATLGMAFNSMSSELAASYASLEERVSEKTARLEQKNQILSFLYQANRSLHSQAPLCQRLSSVLRELQTLTPLSHLTLRVYRYQDEENYDEYRFQSDSGCEARGCTFCAPASEIPVGETSTQKWRLTDNNIQYGLVLGLLPLECQLTSDQQQLILTLMEQLTVTLALERQHQRQQQLLVMEERSAIARELHDSIAQSLSCLKMQLSCLQMQGADLPPEMQSLLEQMRSELNASWLQLRELLTTFRLRLSEPGLHYALEACCREFSEKLGFEVTLEDELPSRLVPPNQAIHLLHIAREALNNSLKHAQATACGVKVVLQDQRVVLTIWDNGCGMPQSAGGGSHYGLIIMRDRAQILKGELQIGSQLNKGTEIKVSFIPESGTGAQNV